MTTPGDRGPHKGVRGFELDIHVAFAWPLPEAQARRELLALDGFHVELYRPHASPTRPDPQAGVLDGAGVPSARLIGPLHDAEAVRAGLAALLSGPARYVEIGRRGFLRAASGQTEWMPWRRNVVLSRHDTALVLFDEGVKYVLE